MYYIYDTQDEQHTTCNVKLKEKSKTKTNMTGTLRVVSIGKEMTVRIQSETLKFSVEFREDTCRWQGPTQLR